MENRQLVSVLLVLLLLIAAGGYMLNDDGTVSDNIEDSDKIADEWDVFYVASENDLPACDSDTLGRLYYVEADAGFQTCTSGGWSMIDLTGSPGVDGQDGVDGINGSASPDTILTDIITLDKSECDAGGRVMKHGLDNGGGGGNAQNGVLEAGEVDYTTTYCSNYKLQLVKDIHRGSPSGSPWRLTAVGDTLYFQAWGSDDSFVDYGIELWKSDGTEGGTVMVKDINPGSDHSDPSLMTAVGSTLYFRADDGTNGSALWKSDGTREGTVMVKAISSSYSISFNNTLYFKADDGIHGWELWKSDGTAVGTVMVKDINPGSDSGMSVARMDAVMGDALYFTADDGTHGLELWKSDGTAEGTVMVKDIYVGDSTDSSQPLGFIAIDDTLYFRAYDDYYGSELWKSDGTTEGTVMVKDINPSTASGYPTEMMAVGSTLYFRGYDAWGSELWKSDGTEGGTVMVKDINTGPDNSNPSYLTAFNNTLYFQANDGTNEELWKSDGTTVGTVMVKDTYLDPIGSSPMYLFVFDGALYFFTPWVDFGYDLWKSDGTVNGTEHWCGVCQLHDESRAVVDGTLFITVSSELGYELHMLGVEHRITYD